MLILLIFYDSKVLIHYSFLKIKLNCLSKKLTVKSKILFYFLQNKLKETMQRESTILN